jgi:hypothetical protein
VGRRSGIPLQACFGILRPEHVHRGLIAQGIGSAGGGVELVENPGLAAPAIQVLIAELPQQSSERMTPKVMIFPASRALRAFSPACWARKQDWEC